MITKAEIQNINFKDNTCLVRVPYFESAGVEGTAIMTATFSNTPGLYNGYQVGDVVFIAFDDGQAEAPVVIGKLYLGTKEENATPRGSLNVTNLTVQNSATLPTDTKIVASKNENIREDSGGIAAFDSLGTLIDSVRSSKARLTAIEDGTKLVPGLGNKIYTQEEEPRGEKLAIGDLWIYTGTTKYVANSIGNIEDSYNANIEKVLGYYKNNDGTILITAGNAKNEFPESTIWPVLVYSIDKANNETRVWNGTAWEIATDSRIAALQTASTQITKDNFGIKIQVDGKNSTFTTADNDKAKWPNGNINGDILIYRGNGIFNNIGPASNISDYYNKYIFKNSEYVLVLPDVYENDIELGVTDRYNLTVPKDAYFIWQYNEVSAQFEWQQTSEQALSNLSSYSSSLEQQADNIKAKVEKTHSGSISGFGWDLTDNDWTISAYTGEEGKKEKDIDILTVNKEGMELNGNLTINGYPKEIEKWYVLSDSDKEHPDFPSGDDKTPWTPEPPEREDDKYIWELTRTHIWKYNKSKEPAGWDENIEEKYVCITGATGADAINYWLVFTSKVHLGKNQDTDITITAKKKIGNATEENDTTADIYINGTKKGTGTYTIPKADITNADIAVDGKHGTTVFDTEKIIFSPKDVPVISLSNDSEAIAYNTSGHQIGDEVATSTATVYFNGGIVSSGISYRWTADYCTISGSPNSATVKIAADSYAKDLCTVTCNATCTNYKDASDNAVVLSKVFTITKQYQGEQGGKGDTGTSVGSVTKFYKLSNSEPDKPTVRDPDTDQSDVNKDWHQSPVAFDKDDSNLWKYYECERTIYSDDTEINPHFEWGTVVLASMLDVKFINALGITAKKITVEANEKTLFEANGLPEAGEEPSVQIGGFNVNYDRLSFNENSSTRAFNLANLSKEYTKKRAGIAGGAGKAVLKITFNQDLDHFTFFIDSIVPYITAYNSSTKTWNVNPNYLLVTTLNIPEGEIPEPDVVDRSKVKFTNYNNWHFTDANQIKVETAGQIEYANCLTFYNIKANDFFYIQFKYDNISSWPRQGSAYAFLPNNAPITVTGDSWPTMSNQVKLDTTKLTLGSFSVQNSGAFTATEGTIGPWTISANGLASNYIGYEYADLNPNDPTIPEKYRYASAYKYDKYALLNQDSLTFSAKKELDPDTTKWDDYLGVQKINVSTEISAGQGVSSTNFSKKLYANSTWKSVPLVCNIRNTIAGGEDCYATLDAICTIKVKANKTDEWTMLPDSGVANIIPYFGFVVPCGYFTEERAVKTDAIKIKFLKKSEDQATATFKVYYRYLSDNFDQQGQPTDYAILVLFGKARNEVNAIN